jgi:YVTN family beta-propeller protein
LRIEPASLLGFLLTLMLVGSGCAASSETASPDAGGGDEAMQQGTISFSEDVQPVLQDDFAPLLDEEEGVQLDSWQDVVAGSEDGELLIPYDAANSLLIELATKREMPEGVEGPTQDEIDLVRRWINRGAKSDAGEVPFADSDSPRLYVCNQGEALVSVIDMQANQVIRTIDLQERGFSANAKPHHAIAEADGSHWYLTMIGENTVLKFNRENEIVERTQFEVPGLLALDPTSDRLFVGRSMSAVNPPKRIGLIDRSDMSVQQVGVFHPRPHAIAVNPEGTYAFSASLAQNRLAAVDANTQEVNLATVSGPTQTFVDYAMAPDGNAMATGGQFSGKLMFFDISDPPAVTVTDSVSVNSQPWHPTYTPDGEAIYFGNKTANTVTVVDAGERAVETVIEGEGIAQPHGSAVRPDGRYVYISNNNRKGAYTPRYDLGDNRNAGTVTVIDTRTNEIVKVIEVEDYPSGIGGPAVR